MIEGEAKVLPAPKASDPPAEEEPPPKSSDDQFIAQVLAEVDAAAAAYAPKPKRPPKDCGFFPEN